MENNHHLPPTQGCATESLLTRREAAAYLRVTEATLAVWACTQRYELPYLKAGRSVRYRKCDLDKFLSRQLTANDLP